MKLKQLSPLKLKDYNVIPDNTNLINRYGKNDLLKVDHQPEKAGVCRKGIA